MDNTLFGAFISFQRKMKYVLQNILNQDLINNNLYTGYSFVVINFDSFFDEKKSKPSIEMCIVCEICNSNPTTIGSYGDQCDPDYSEYINCRCAINNLDSRLESLIENRNYIKCFRKNNKKKIVFKCCSICGQYLYGGTSILKCIDPSHHKYDNLKMIDEDRKYLHHLLKVTRSIGYQYNGGWDIIYPDFQMIIVLAFHLETKYFFLNQQDLFKHLCEFLSNDPWNIFFVKSMKLLSFHTPPL
jgi:hypothetical protein